MPTSEHETLARRARAAFERRDWLTARDDLLAAEAIAPLHGADAYALGDAIWWLGGFRQAVVWYETAFERFQAEGDRHQAAMAALAVAVSLLMRGETATGSAWYSRVARLLADQPANPVHLYVSYTEFGGALDVGDLDAALACAGRLQAGGQEFGDPNLTGPEVLAEARVRLRQGDVRAGIVLLDEAMLIALTDKLEPSWCGHIYCELMRACHELRDLSRAREWTLATARWCESLPAAGPFMGVCRVHRSQVFQTQGDWDRAQVEAERVCEELAGFDLVTVAEGHYQRGELRRLRGDVAGAEASYAEAHQLGRDPQPGLALLRLAQGRVTAAGAAVTAALAAQGGNRLGRAPLLTALVEVALAGGDVPGARAANDELQRIAATYRSSGLEAASLAASGAVLLAEGDAATAVETLRAATGRWLQLDAPYETARTRALLGHAYEALADSDAAQREFAVARATFARLGAEPDARTIDALLDRSILPGGLSEREAEVLALVAAGRTNREVAATLHISEKTVARHLSNIFTKLNVTTRTAAAAFAFEHGLATREHG